MANGPSANRGLSRRSNGNATSQGARKSAHQVRSTTRSNGRKQGKNQVASRNGNGKRNAAMNHNRQNNRHAKSGHNGKANGHHNGAEGGRGTFGTSVNAWSSRSDLAVWGAVPYAVTAGGFVLEGSDSIPLAEGFEIDPGDTIVSVGGIECVESAPALPVLVEQAYRDDNLVVVIREAKTGDVIEVELPAAQPD
jgi:hypothetical protein